MKKTIILASLVIASSAHAYEGRVSKGELAANLTAMLAKATRDTQVNFNSDDFMLIEDRDLATSNYKMYLQTNNYIPVYKTAVRIWSDLKTNELILGELHLDEKAKKNEKILDQKYQKARFSPGAIKSKKLSLAVSEMVSSEISKHSTDSRVISMKFNDVWIDGDLVRRVDVRSRRGNHRILVSLLKNKIIESSYSEFPQADYQTLKANVFPMYEEVESTGEKLPYELRSLKYVTTQVKDGGNNPLGALGSAKFSETHYNPLLAGTPLGEMYDIWSESSLRKKIYEIVNKLPAKANNFSSGLLLQGKFTTINLHPEVKEAFQGINFKLKPSNNHMLNWANVDGTWEAKPVLGFSGRALESSEELANKIPFRLPDHDPTKYINDGFDEVQVYYAVTTLMETLADMGFSDKELSTSPFHAFLYDPDIAMKDNAYYTDNTINFTTYSKDQPNMARDNPTIWHELGHGVMDRLMGEHLGFAGNAGGYGGLSEGMADFVAKIVVEQQTDGVDFPGKEDFRIINDTGFYLTNEFHDEGESYGGAMSDMLNEAIALKGKEGLTGFTDLTLEAMRLTRNHPALSAKAWFENMIYADELGSSVRAEGQFKELIIQALLSRNFSFAADFEPAKMTVKLGDTELTSSSDGSREKPISACSNTGTATFNLKLSATSGTSNFIKFPAVVKVEYKKGALQGAINWAGEDQNPTIYSIKSEADLLSIPLAASMKCDSINQPDGSCKDYAYIQIFNEGDAKPRAKKRFYLKITDQATCK